MLACKPQIYSDGTNYLQNCANGHFLLAALHPEVLVLYFKGTF